MQLSDGIFHLLQSFFVWLWWFWTLYPSENNRTDGDEIEYGYPITCGDSRAVLLFKKFVCPGINVRCVKVSLLLFTDKKYFKCVKLFRFPLSLHFPGYKIAAIRRFYSLLNIDSFMSSSSVQSSLYTWLAKRHWRTGNGPLDWEEWCSGIIVLNNSSVQLLNNFRDPLWYIKPIYGFLFFIPHSNEGFIIQKNPQYIWWKQHILPSFYRFLQEHSTVASLLKLMLCCNFHTSVFTGHSLWKVGQTKRAKDGVFLFRGSSQTAQRCFFFHFLFIKHL